MSIAINLATLDIQISEDLLREDLANQHATNLADRIANTEYSAAHKSPQFKMYCREFPAFSTALYQFGECDPMWDHLRKISNPGASR